MTHIAIFPTWDCQLNCAYCSIKHSKIDRSVKGVDWQAWANGLIYALPRGSLIDIAGGEPFLYPGLLPLCGRLGQAGMLWAITTNAKATEAIEEFCRVRPSGGVCFNVSDHAGNPEAHENIPKLRAAGWQVAVHRVDHPAAGTHEPEAITITYQAWAEGKAVDGIKRNCIAGINHWVADPAGNLWRCVVALETGQPSLGNLFSRKVTKGKLFCDFGCTTCYTENPSEWEVEMREVVT